MSTRRKSAPTTWRDPAEHRRKLAESINLNGLDIALLNHVQSVAATSTLDPKLGRVVFVTNSGVTLTLTTEIDQWVLIFGAFGSSTSTITPSSGTINGAANLSLAANKAALCACNGTNWQALAT